MVVASKIFIAGSTKHCKWVPGCPGNAVTGDDGTQYEDFPAVLASWSQDAKVRSNNSSLSASVTSHACAAAKNPVSLFCRRSSLDQPMSGCRLTLAL